MQIAFNSSMDISGSAFCHATEICFPIVRNLGCKKATWEAS